VTEFAAEELRSYLSRLSDTVTGAVTAAAIRLQCGGGGLPDVPDTELDDAIDIRFCGGRGAIHATNPRALLIGVYRLLRELGCRWVRPGFDGEIIPKLSAADLAAREIRVCETAAHRHRGICIEGAPSREHVLDLIDWMPKAGLNSYFIQFHEPYAFYERWYRHIGNPTLEPEPFDIEMVRTLRREAVASAKTRGLLYHAVGHGWTSEALGISSVSWKADDHALPPERHRLLAQINGQREFFCRIAMNTNLCYGNPEARRRIVEQIVAYAADHSEVDYLHFWLADDVNNQCECPLCAETRPADFYVMMLNTLDRELAARGLATRIVLLCYLDLLWPPERERIYNSNRFALMFAPITRSFSEPFPDKPVAATAPLPPFQRNRLVMPHDVSQNLQFLHAWQKAFPGLDSFDFDYHLMWAHFQDPGHAQISRVLHEDTGRLSTHGMNGFMSCQVQRLFLPTGLPMAILGRNLWNPSEPFAIIEEEQLAAEFGPDWMHVRDLLRELTARIDPARLRGDLPQAAKQSAALFDSIPGLIDEFLVRFPPDRNLPGSVRIWSWRNLSTHLAIWRTLARALAARARGDVPEAHRLWLEALHDARLAEPSIAAVFDLFHFTVTLSHHHFDHIENPAPPATTLEVLMPGGNVVTV
jgi:hypothetical protein